MSINSLPSPTQSPPPTHRVSRVAVQLYKLIYYIIGSVYTDEPMIRSFNRGERLELNVNISNDYYARHISSLAWYHNGTKVTSGNKYIINGDTTMLTVLNMTESDAGTYEAKINSINESSQKCNSRLLLPLLESQAIHAPVSFIVRESSPVYDPNAVIFDYNITDGP